MKCVGVQKTLSVFEGGKVVKLEISYEEYRDLKRRIEELEREQAKAKVLPMKRWAYQVNELPINTIRISENIGNIPFFRYSQEARETWEVFLKLAKHVNRRVAPYEEKKIYGPGELTYCYNWSKKSHDEIPKKYEDLTYEEQKLSIEMLNELIPIYNKYFKLAHPEICIIYRDEKRQFVSVEDA